MTNDYNTLAASYKKSDEKPDKQYSMLPTVIGLAGDLTGKIVLDVGCGSGFFANIFAHSAERVIGIDNSSEQIQMARSHQPPNVDYLVSDGLRSELPRANLVNAPFVLGYLETMEELKKFFSNVYNCLSDGGRFIAIIDTSSGSDLRKYGARKKLHGTGEGAKLEITLYNQNEEICTLWATYHEPETVTQLLSEVGFKDIEWHKPIVSEKGFENMPEGFWDGYVDNCELGYVTADKSK
jgi:SAM-dependent methyltransferase